LLKKQNCIVIHILTITVAVPQKGYRGTGIVSSVMHNRIYNICLFINKESSQMSFQQAVVVNEFYDGTTR